MPFVTQEHRDNPDMEIPGDRCYFYYKQMVEAWKKSPRWTTADTIYQEILYDPSPVLRYEVARKLAWQVFFQRYVMPYEDLKEKANGTI